MARQEQRTAAKDYPDHGIKKGDRYWFAQIKTGQRSSKTIRSLSRIPESQMTTSPFKSGWFAVQEAWEASDKDGDAIRAAADTIRELGEEARGSFDNMPYGLQQGDTGQMLEARADACESAAGDLESLADEWDALDEPVEPLGDLETDEENDVAREEYENELENFESEQERIRDEADGHIGEMPE